MIFAIICTLSAYNRPPSPLTSHIYVPFAPAIKIDMTKKSASGNLSPSAPSWPPAGAVQTSPTLLQCLAVFFVSNMFMNSVLLMLAAAWLLPPRYAGALFAAYYAHVFWSRAHVHGWSWRPLARGGRAASAWLRYFSPAIVVEPGLRAGAQYIFACSPHGIHGFGTGFLLAEDSAFYDAAPFLRGRLVGLGAWILFHLPLVREVFLAAGWRDASRPVAAAALRAGASLYIIIGGEAEALRSAPGRDDAVVAGAGRRGFVRLALAHGAQLVPFYTFRNTDTFRTSAACFSARRWLTKVAQICLPLWAGRAGSALPFNVQLTVAVGAPVPFPAGYAPPPPGADARPSDAHVDAYHAAFVDALRATFERHKARAGYPPERVLNIHEA